MPPSPGGGDASLPGDPRDGGGGSSGGAGTPGTGGRGSSCRLTFGHGAWHRGVRVPVLVPVVVLVLVLVPVPVPVLGELPLTARCPAPPLAPFIPRPPPSPCTPPRPGMAEGKQGKTKFPGNGVGLVPPI